MFFTIAGNYLAVFCTGLSIKIMDDFLDQEKDRVQGKRTWVQHRGGGACVYALISLLIGAVLNLPFTGSLFLAAYSLGMLRSMPNPRWDTTIDILETFLALGLGFYLWGWQCMAGAFFMILAIDLFDDLLDKEYFIHQYALIKKLLYSVMAFLLALFLTPEKAILVMAAVPPILYCLEGRWNKKQ